MPSSLESFTESLRRLVHRFEAETAHFLSKDYSEAQARIDFITPLFKALGWDVENEAGLPHHEREVLVEKGETEGRPDYNFRVGGQTKFFVEAKAPREPLDAPVFALQAKSYAWNTKQVFFVVLTGFDEFRFYDATIVPDERRPHEGLLLKLSYAEYLENAGKLWEFSRERVLAGSLDALLPRSRQAQRMRIPVDKAFLEEMTGWREDLARNVYKNNPELTAKQLNEVVQRLLDRIVFVRIAEDRHIIERRQLLDAVDDWKSRGGKFHIFAWLNDIFRAINEDFNGEIFKPHLSENIHIDSEALASIIERLYSPRSPYRFDVIGVELLGSIYERYLGKTIRVTPKRVFVEDKPEVRKAGGVYYTPKYIVDYIVKETVGKIIEGKTPKQIEKIRILDPACGSGSFLIGAFQYLIDYHARYLAAHPEEAQVHPLFPDLIRDQNGEPRLSVIRKARILKNNLFGVDIDPQAVEITMMSLYLKALEGERSQFPPKQHLLPELKYNIICGNSLIGPDIFDQGLLFADEERDRINAFDWYAVPPPVILSASEESAFQPAPGQQQTLRSAQGDKPPRVSDRRDSSVTSASGQRPGRRSEIAATAPSIGQVMREGGFDCVIGNPPYVRIQHLKEWAPIEVEYYKEHYKSAGSGNYDIYVVFAEKGLSVLRQGGRLGFILPHKFFNSKYGQPLRSVVASGNHLSKVVHFGDQQVFEGATNYTCLLFLDKSGSRELNFEKVSDLDAWRDSGMSTAGKIAAGKVTAVEWNFTVGNGKSLFEKLRKMPVSLGDVAEIFVGLQTSADTVFLFKDSKKPLGAISRVFSKELNKPVSIESALLKPVIRSGDIGRFWGEPNALVLFPYNVVDGKARLIPERQMKQSFPKAWDYLLANRSMLSKREHGKFRGTGWYQLYPKNLDRWERPKIMLPYMITQLSAFYDERNNYFVNVTTGGFGVTVKPAKGSIKYFTGLLNSRLLDWYLKNVSTTFHGGYLAANKQFIERLPIRPIDFSNPADKARHDRIVVLVERMLELNKRKHSGKLAPSQIDRVDREIASTDAEIDNLVYELYGITDEERKIIEDAHA